MTHFETVFDISSAIFPWFSVALGLGLVFIGIFIRYSIQKRHLLLDGWRRKVGKSIHWFVPIIFILVGLLTCIGSYHQYHDFQHDSATGHYKTVEGAVTEFQPMLNCGKGLESFRVNNILFRYSKNVLTSAFNTPACLGGPIHEGLYVRIAYIVDSSPAWMINSSTIENSIIKLEIRKEK